MGVPRSLLEPDCAAARSRVLTENITISLIGAIATVAVSVINAFISLSARRRGKRNETHIEETKQAVQSLTQQTNGMQEQLLKVTSESEYAKGLKDGSLGVTTS